MIAEILSTGNEVLSGVVVDSNAAHIARVLEVNGLEVRRHTCVGDEIEEIAVAVGEIAGRAEVLLITGGLGPTGDDVTSAAVARAAGVELVFNQEARQSMDDFFIRRGLTTRLADDKQALLPEGARCLVNPVGTAPGFALSISGCLILVLPGVPREMEQMMTTAVLPEIEAVQAGV